MRRRGRRQDSRTGSSRIRRRNDISRGRVVALKVI
jgi:hypothetical protein